MAEFCIAWFIHLSVKCIRGLYLQKDPSSDFPAMTELTWKSLKCVIHRRWPSHCSFLLAVFALWLFLLFFQNKEEFDEISWKERQEIKNLDERKLNLIKTYQQKNPVKLSDEKISSTVI